jgi:hypothetical protein
VDPAEGGNPFLNVAAERISIKIRYPGYVAFLDCSQDKALG